MRSAQPSHIATWLLRHFGCSPNNDVIIGDLDEQYRQGRSRLWYWRQALLAMLAAWFDGIRAHKISTACTLALSWIHVVALGRVFGYLARGAANPLTAFLLPYHWWGRNSVFWPVDWLLTWSPLFLISICTGWVIGLFSRRHAPAMVLTCFVFTCIVVAPPTFRMLAGLPMVPLFFSVRGLFIPFQTLLGILLGGGLLTTPRSVSLQTS